MSKERNNTRKESRKKMVRESRTSGKERTKAVKK